MYQKYNEHFCWFLILVFIFFPIGARKRMIFSFKAEYMMEKRIKKAFVLYEKALYQFKMKKYEVSLNLFQKFLKEAPESMWKLKKDVKRLVLPVAEILAEKEKKK